MKKDIIRIGSILVIVAIAFYVFSTQYKSTEQQAASTYPNNEKLVREWSPRQGPAMAKVQVVEFLDPECESCRAVHPIVKRILKQFDGQILYVIRYMPFHGNSKIAASWLEAAREQDKYWEALDILFDRQPQWGSHHNPRPELIAPILQLVGVDVEKAKVDKDKPEILEQINQDQKDGMELGVSGTPTFFINGKKLMSLSEAGLVSMIEEELGN